MARSIEERLNRNIDKTGHNGCWVWTASKNRGYGQIMFDGSMWLAHRVMYWLAKGPFDRSLCVLHRCDNPPCCNPDHLFLGDRDDNAKDMVKKGRYDQNGKRHWPRGIKHGNAKFTDDQIREIRALYDTGKWTQVNLAKRFNTSQSNISVIVLKQHWAHL